MGKSSAPPPVDQAAVAQAQGQANQDTALFNTNVNRADQVGPGGSTTWTMKPGADPKNPQPGDYVQTQSYSPANQALYDASQRTSQNLAGVAEQGVNRVGAAMGTPFDTSGLPDRQVAPEISQNAVAGAPNTGIDDTGLNKLNGDYGAQVKAVQDAFMSRQTPQLDQNQQATENRLLNSGIERGSEAWNREQATLGQNRNDANQQAILAGSAEQSRLAGLDLAARSQGFSERAADASMGNAAQAQTFGQTSAIDQLKNAFNQNSAQFNNETRQQGIQEQAYTRQLPLNELNALRSGAQVQGPTFGSYYTGGNAGAPDVAGGANAGYNQSLAATNASNANSASTAATIGSVAAAAIMAY